VFFERAFTSLGVYPNRAVAGFDLTRPRLRGAFLGVLMPPGLVNGINVPPVPLTPCAPAECRKSSAIHIPDSTMRE
jgi:hypothetical protein